MSGSADADAEAAADFAAAFADVEAAAKGALHEEETDFVTWVSSEECARATMLDPELSRLHREIEKVDRWHALRTERATKLLLFLVLFYVTEKKGYNLVLLG